MRWTAMALARYGKYFTWKKKIFCFLQQINRSASMNELKYPSRNSFSLGVSIVLLHSTFYPPKYSTFLLEVPEGLKTLSKENNIRKEFSAHIS
jgi:hypothetical protein